MSYLTQPPINDPDGEFFLTCGRSHRNPTDQDPWPVQRLMIVSHEPSERCVRVNRETVVALHTLADKGVASVNDTAFAILAHFDIWSSVTRDGMVKMSPENLFLVYLGEKVEPVILGEFASLAEVG